MVRNQNAIINVRQFKFNITLSINKHRYDFNRVAKIMTRDTKIIRNFNRNNKKKPLVYRVKAYIIAIVHIKRERLEYVNSGKIWKDFQISKIFLLLDIETILWIFGTCIFRVSIWVMSLLLQECDVLDCVHSIENLLDQIEEITRFGESRENYPAESQNIWITNVHELWKNIREIFNSN